MQEHLKSSCINRLEHTITRSIVNKNVLEMSEEEVKLANLPFKCDL